MKSTLYKLIEFFVIFILIPVSYAIPYSWQLKLTVGLLGFLYVIYILLKVEKNKFKLAPNLNWRLFWERTALKFLVLAILTTLFVRFSEKANLFEVFENKPRLWFVMVLIYTVFSVYPQELIYRTLYFQRYESLFKNKLLFIVLNAIVFSMAHLFFRNTLVHILTFIGGIIFALTYNKTRSTVMVSIEHAIYGCWLFTVGMGSMLGFPS